jgi:hypothetical protein
VVKSEKLQVVKIWERIVLFANSDASDSADNEMFAAFRACVRWIDPGVVGELSSAVPAAVCKDVADIREGTQSYTALATKYQAEIKKVLFWLSKWPEKVDPELAKEALAILRHNVDAIEWEFHVNDRLDASVRRTAFYFELTVQYQLIASPISLFIWRQMERYRQSGGQLKEIIPLGLCDRPGCGRFRVVKNRREGRFFCSNLCKATFHQNAKPKEEKAKYMRERRTKIERLKMAKTNRRTEETRKSKLGKSDRRKG